MWCWAQLCASLNTGLVLLSFQWPFPIVVLLVVVVAVVCHRFAPLLIPDTWPLAFAPNTLTITHNFLNQAFPKTFLNMAFPKTMVYKPWLKQNQCFCFKTDVPQRLFLHKNRIIHKHHVLHKSHVLAGLVQGLFAARRIALSMVASGTRRRRVNTIWSLCLVWTSKEHNQHIMMWM